METIQEKLDKKSADDLVAIVQRCERIRNAISEKGLLENETYKKKAVICARLEGDALHILNYKFNQRFNLHSIPVEYAQFMEKETKGNLGLGSWDYLFEQYKVK